MFGQSWIPNVTRRHDCLGWFIGFLTKSLHLFKVQANHSKASLSSNMTLSSTPPRSFPSRSSIWVMPRVSFAPLEDENSMAPQDSHLGAPLLVDENLSNDHPLVDRIPSSTSVDSQRSGRSSLGALRDLTNTCSSSYQSH